MSADRPPLEVLLERVVFAPIGVMVAWRDELPKLAAQGRREVDLARMFGRFAVEQGKRELDKRLRPPTPTRVPAAATVPTSETGLADAVASAEVIGGSRRRASSPSSPKPPATASPGRRKPPAVSALPIAEYDSLAASQVVARLAALTPVELARIEAYETAGRGRRTILGKIAQLRAPA